MSRIFPFLFLIGVNTVLGTDQLLWNNYYQVFDLRLDATFKSSSTLATAHQLALKTNSTSVFTCATYIEAENLGKSKQRSLLCFTSCLIPDGFINSFQNTRRGINRYR